jgi:hypothetical protein
VKIWLIDSIVCRSLVAYERLARSLSNQVGIGGEAPEQRLSLVSFRCGQGEPDRQPIQVAIRCRRKSQK